MLNFENTISKKDFISQYWEKKPLVFRNVLDAPTNIVDPEDLLEMAQDEELETRLISFNGEWSNYDGPFESKFIKDHPSWTLINHNIENQIPEIERLKKNLSFLPLWLFDDAMTTYSNKDSSVGAHIDNYNVFIIQLSGSRKWQIQYNPNPEFQKGLEVKILKEFNFDEEFILNPGDMIYIPPHIAHHGISQTESLSLSLGFKSLEYDKLLNQLGLTLLEAEIEDQFYKTNFKETIQSAFEIDEKNLKNLKENLIEKLKDSNFLEETILKFTTTPKNYPDEAEFSYEEFVETFKKKPLYRDEFARLSFLKSKNQNISLSINNKLFETEQNIADKINMIFLKSLEEPIQFEQDSQYLECMFFYLNLGAFYFLD